MARYTVVWSSILQSTLAEEWLRSTSQMRARLTRTAHLIDIELAESPELLGRPAPFEPSSRTLDIELGDTIASVTFKALPEDRIVRVVRVTLRQKQ